jgi:transposase
VVHDRYALYDHPQVGDLTHQLCCQHILRDLEDAAETYPDAHWPVQIQDALRELIHHTNLARNTGAEAIPTQVTDPLIHTFRHGVLVGLSEVGRTPGPKPTTKQPIGRTLLETLRDRENDVLRFVGDLRVPPTSNQAERDVRPAKTQQNISGRLTSEATTRDRYRIRGVISTAAKHGLDQLKIIRDALVGKPWIPALPAPTQPTQAITPRPAADSRAGRHTPLPNATLATGAECLPPSLSNRTEYVITRSRSIAFRRFHSGVDLLHSFRVTRPPGRSW